MIHATDPDWLVTLREIARTDPLVHMGLQMADRDWVPLDEALGRVCAHQADELRHYREIVFQRRQLETPPILLSCPGADHCPVIHLVNKDPQP